VVARSKVWTVFARLNAGIVGSNPVEGIEFCIVWVYAVFMLFCVGRGLATGWFPIRGALLTVYRIKKLKRVQGPTKGRRAVIIIQIKVYSSIANNSYFFISFIRMEFLSSGSVVGGHLETGPFKLNVKNNCLRLVTRHIVFLCQYNRLTSFILLHEFKNSLPSHSQPFETSSKCFLTCHIWQLCDIKPRPPSHSFIHSSVALQPFSWALVSSSVS
jgi:hypothetical protein